MQIATGSVTGFTGVLIDRQYRPGQKYVQLVFDTAEGMRLSLSRNADMVRSLNVGRTYHIKGQELQVGRKRYIHEPSATLVESITKPTKRYGGLVIFIAVMVFAGVPAAALYAGQQGANPNSVDINKGSVEQNQVQPSGNAVVPVPESQPTSAATETNEVAATPSAVTKKATTASRPAASVTQPQTSTPVVQSPATAPEPAPQQEAPVVVPPVPEEEVLPPEEPPLDEEPPVDEPEPADPVDETT